MLKRDQAQGSHQRPRTRAVRHRIALLLVVPMLSLIALWAFATGITLSAALVRFDFSTIYERVGGPVGAVAQAIQEERAAAAALLGVPDAANRERFQQRSRRTDAAIASFRASAFSAKTRDAADKATMQNLATLDRTFGELGTLRAQVATGGVDPLAAVESYSLISDSTIQLLSTTTSVDDIHIQRRTGALLYSYWARDLMLRQDALLSSLPAKGRMTAEQRAAFAAWAGSRGHFSDLALAGLDGELRRMQDRLIAAPEFARYQSLEQSIGSNGVNTADGPALETWRATVPALSRLWLSNSMQSGQVLNRQAEDIGGQIMVRFFLAGGVGLLAVAVSVALSVLFTRGVSAELGGLQRAAQDLAHERLPRVVARLRRGERVDVDAEAPRPAAGRTREISLVADAFAAVQRTAIETAVGEAELRGSINRVFVNLSWRSQSLLHRQLKLLDAMERRATSPEELDDLFRLDHLTTRMRRHAEGLVILSGSPTVRSWDHPVLVEDVVRAAVAEVEDYTRVDVAVGSAAAVTGTVVADVIHLLAELIENATAFSPPTTEVLVRAETVANGLAVEVVDRGIGIHPQQLAEINRRLTDPPEFDLADSDRLGLFVVARLAVRHGIKVSLQPSAYGGTTAVVLLPHSLVVPEERKTPTEPMPVPAVREPRYTAHAHRPPASPSPTGRLGRPMPPRDFPPAGPPPAADGAGIPEAESSEITGRLPRRRRQENLAPQLRGTDRPRAARRDEAGDLDEPDPELRRDLMSSLQSGWLRGRDTDEETTDPADADPWSERGER